MMAILSYGAWLLSKKVQQCYAAGKELPVDQADIDALPIIGNIVDIFFDGRYVRMRR